MDGYYVSNNYEREYKVIRIEEYKDGHKEAVEITTHMEEKVDRCRD